MKCLSTAKEQIQFAELTLVTQSCHRTLLIYFLKAVIGEVPYI
ncbi:hypothetical protein [Sideroxydans sp. CL21]|nr:hypothetical protein [Sideroxydans sp. CL21]